MRNRMIDEEYGARLDGLAGDGNGSVARHVTVTFKKSFSGFDVNEVMEYIEQQDENYASTCKMYDSKIDGFKSDISMLNREKDSYKAQIDQLKKELEEKSSRIDEIMAMSPAAFAEAKQNTGEGDMPDFMRAQIEAETREMKGSLNAANKQIEELKELVIEMKSENARLNDEQKKGEGNAKTLVEAQYKISELGTDIEWLNEQIAERDSTIRRCNEENARLATVAEQSKELYASVEKLNAQTEAYKKAVRDIQTRLVEKTEQYDMLNSTNDHIKRQLADFESKIQDMQEQMAETDKKYADLVDTNMQLKREFSTKRNEMEAEFNAQKYKLLQAAQIHSCQFRQVELVMEELKKHFEAAKETLENISE